MNIGILRTRLWHQNDSYRLQILQPLTSLEQHCNCLTTRSSMRLAQYFKRYCIVCIFLERSVARKEFSENPSIIEALKKREHNFESLCL